MAKSSNSTLGGIASELPLDRLKGELSQFGQALAQKGLGAATDRVESLTGRLTDIAEGTTTGKAAKNMAQGDSPVKAGLKGVASKATDKVKDAVSNLTGSGGSGSNTKLKVTNILEYVDVPVNRQVAYDQWTQFEDFPKFMKKVENVSQEEDEKLAWKAQIFWSHRSWTATITDQVPGERIVWKSQGQKGHVDGAITFHELSPDLTRVMMVLEYHPKGLFEHTGNLWRAQGRRARLELKHFARHVSTNTLLHQDELEGWQGEIHEGKVVEQGSSGSDEGSRRKRGSNGDDSSGSSSRSSRSSRSSSGSSGSSSSRNRSERSSGNGSRRRGGAEGSSPHGGDSSARPAKKAAGRGGSTSGRPAKKASGAQARKSATGSDRTRSQGAAKKAAQRPAKKTTAKRGG